MRPIRIDSLEYAQQVYVANYIYNYMAIRDNNEFNKLSGTLRELRNFINELNPNHGTIVITNGSGPVTLQFGSGDWRAEVTSQAGGGFTIQTEDGGGWVTLDTEEE